MTEIELRALMKEPNLREERIYLYKNRRKRKESTEMSWIGILKGEKGNLSSFLWIISTFLFK